MDRFAYIVASRFRNRMALGVGNTFESETWRIHRYANSLVITDLTFAGKRGKKVTSWVLMPHNDRMFPMESVSDEFVMWAKRNAPPSKMKAVIDEQKEVFGAELDVHERTERGVDVTPGGFKPVLVRGAHVTIEADYDSFSIKDINDDANEPTCIAQGKKSVKQFYRWVSDNARKVQSMNLSQIMDALKAEQIDFHYYCAVD